MLFAMISLPFCESFSEQLFKTSFLLFPFNQSYYCSFTLPLSCVTLLLCTFYSWITRRLPFPREIHSLKWNFVVLNPLTTQLFIQKLLVNNINYHVDQKQTQFTTKAVDVFYYRLLEKITVAHPMHRNEYELKEDSFQKRGVL